MFRQLRSFHGIYAFEMSYQPYVDVESPTTDTGCSTSCCDVKSIWGRYALKNFNCKVEQQHLQLCLVNWMGVLKTDVGKPSRLEFDIASRKNDPLVKDQQRATMDIIITYVSHQPL